MWILITIISCHLQLELPQDLTSSLTTGTSTEGTTVTVINSTIVLL